MFRKNGATSVKTRVALVDSSTGLAKTGLSTASGGLIISAIADTEASGTAYSSTNLETITTCGTFAAPTSGKVRFKEVDATNHPGLYEIQIADARWGVSNAQTVQVTVAATGVNTAHKEVQLTSFDPYDAVRLGLTALPNAAASAVGGIPVAVDTSGRVDVLKINGTSQTAGDIFARLGAPAGASISADVAAVKTDTAAIKAKTDNLPASPAATGAEMTLTTGERTAIANEVEAQIIDDTDSEKVLQAITDKIASVNPSLDDLTLGGIASAVRTELTTELARIDAAVSSRMATFSYTAPDNSSITAIKAKTDNLPAAPAAVADIPTALQNADTVLNRDLSAVSDTNERSLLNFARTGVNKVSVDPDTGLITVYKENGSTVAFTLNSTTDAEALPIVSVTPA